MAAASYGPRALGTALCLLALLGAGDAATADNISAYPDKPIHIIVPFAPGGASDYAIRLIQPGLTQALGQQLVIDNRSGAAGNVGMEAAARAAPDGYTLFFGNVGTVSINPHFFPELNLAPERDFIPISIAAETPGILIASPKFPANSLKEMIDYVKAHPGKINYAAAGISTLNTLAMEQFRHVAGLQMTQIPYKGGAGPAIVDLMAGNVARHAVFGRAAREDQKAEGLRGEHARTRRIAARGADAVRTGLPGSSEFVMAGAVRRGANAAADRSEAARGRAQGDGRSGHTEAHAHGRHVADIEPNAGKLQAIPRR